MKMLRQLDRKLYLSIGCTGAYLGVLVSSLSLPAKAQESITYPATQIDCSNTPAPPRPEDLIIVEVPTGFQTVAEFCQVQGPVQQLQRIDASPWGPSYRIGNSICRDRRGVDTVCVTPSAAVRLRWEIPSQ